MQRRRGAEVAVGALGVELDRHARLGAAGAWVALELLLARHEWLASLHANDRHVSAHADRQVWRAGATLGELVEEVLHDAVLKRVVADDADAATGICPANRRLQPPLEHLELVVNLDAQGLEGLARRVPSLAACRRGDAGLDGVAMRGANRSSP